jgi:hypothetical protein
VQGIFNFLSLRHGTSVDSSRIHALVVIDLDYRPFTRGRYLSIHLLFLNFTTNNIALILKGYFYEKKRIANLLYSFIQNRVLKRGLLNLVQNYYCGWPRDQCVRRAIADTKQRSRWSVIGWVTKIYYFGTLSRWFCLHFRVPVATC